MLLSATKVTRRTSGIVENGDGGDKILAVAVGDGEERVETMTEEAVYYVV